MVLLSRSATMITFKKGNILEEEVDAIVNTVNCVGVMGRGIALQFKKMYPENFKAYESACKQDKVQPGIMYTYKLNRALPPYYIANFPTKRHWRGKSKLSDIKVGLKSLLDDVIKNEISSIAIPPLGCGLGGLNWSEVKPLIIETFESVPNVDVIVFEPQENSEERSTVSKNEIPQMTPGRAALVGLIDRYLKGHLDPFVTLLEIHKLMYFMQEAGQPLRLNYQKGHYGPYAKNLRHVLSILEGHMTSGYSDGGDAPDKIIQLVPGASQDAAEFLLKNADTHNKFNKVSELVSGFESSFGLELLATVHWVIKNENVRNNEELISAIYSWNSKKKKFSETQILKALENLIRHGWVKPFKAA